MEFYISHVKIKVKFYSVKNGILYILHVKMSVLNLCHETLNFSYLLYENLCWSFLHEILYFLYFIWIYGWWLPILHTEPYISQMKIMALVFFRYEEPICYWSYPYFTNENIYTTVFSWNMEFLYFLYQNLCLNTLSWNLEFCIFHIWRSE